MNNVLIILTLSLLAVVPFRAFASKAESPAAYEHLSLSALEQQAEAIDAELKTLSKFSLRGGIGVIGFRSKPSATPEHVEWIQINLDKETIIDEIILVPTIWRHTKKGLQADGFPETFSLFAGTDSDATGQLIASFDPTDQILPRIAPLIIPTGPLKASWVRIEATRLAQRAYDSQYTLQLAEIMIFSGQHNVALHREVITSSNDGGMGGAWHNAFLNDGTLPYLMDSAQGSKSLAYISKLGELPALCVDLEAAHTLSRIHLYAVDSGDTFPQAYSSSLGTTPAMVIEGANRKDFSDAFPLQEILLTRAYAYAPILMWEIPPVSCRYVRVRNTDPDRPYRFSRIGFAEIELYDDNINVALHKPTWASEPHSDSGRPIAHLTDGQNLYGKILPYRAWMNELARRHDLEVKRPFVMKELAKRYDRQKTNLKRVSWLAGLLAAGTVITILMGKIIRQRAIFRTKERIAANLHDELGANLHAIGLFSDLAKKEVSPSNASPQLRNYLEEVKKLTKETGATARYCTDLLEAHEQFEDLAKEMRYLFEHLLADLQLEFHIDHPEQLHRLKSRRRIDLYLFYKECLINVARHSGATQVKTVLQLAPRKLTLIVTDNGCGLTNQHPKSLKRRARLLGGKFFISSPASGGTTITLTLTPRTFGFGALKRAPAPPITQEDQRKP